MTSFSTSIDGIVIKKNRDSFFDFGTTYQRIIVINEWALAGTGYEASMEYTKAALMDVKQLDSRPSR